MPRRAPAAAGRRPARCTRCTPRRAPVAGRRPTRCTRCTPPPAPAEGRHPGRTPPPGRVPRTEARATPTRGAMTSRGQVLALRWLVAPVVAGSFALVADWTVQHDPAQPADHPAAARSEERRVGKEGRAR